LILTPDEDYFSEVVSVRGSIAGLDAAELQINDDAMLHRRKASNASMEATEIALSAL
jgi:hypothetical protein